MTNETTASQPKRIGDDAPIYQRQEEGGSWRDTTLLGKQAWEASGRPTRIVATIQEPAMVAESVGKTAVDQYGTTRCASCDANLDINEEHGDDCSAAAPMVADPAAMPLAATVKAVPSEALDEAPIKCWSADQEDFNATELDSLLTLREELKPGDTVWVGEAVRPEPFQLIDADDIMTTMGERAYDIAGEHADEYPDVSKEAEQELNELLAGWIRKHAKPTFWTVDNIKPYVLGANDFAAPLADKTDGGDQ